MQAVGERIKEARERLGLTQEQLAKQVKLKSGQIISGIEGGKRALKVSELASFARALLIDYQVLLGTVPADPDACVVWRVEAGASREQEARFIGKCRQYQLVEELTGYGQTRHLPSEDFSLGPQEFSNARTMAASTSRSLGLGSSPAVALAEVLEHNCSVRIWYFPLAEEGSSACARGSFGDAILVDADEAPWRRNFNLGHELFHLLTWNYTRRVWEDGSTPQRKRLEDCANVFASSLLLPEEPLRNLREKKTHEGTLSYGALVEIAREFEVSTEALVWRLVSLREMNRGSAEKVLQDDQFRGLDRLSMRAHWSHPPASPQRFARLAFFAQTEGKLSRARLAEFLDTNLVDLPGVLEEYGLHDGEDYGKTISAAGRSRHS